MRKLVRLMILFFVLTTTSIFVYGDDSIDDFDESISIDIKRVPPRLRSGVVHYQEKALLRVAKAFEFGDGVEKDVDFSAKWYARAAYEANSKVAKAWLTKEMEKEEISAVIYMKGRDLRMYGDKDKDLQGLDLIRRAAEVGYPEAERDLGLIYYNGKDVKKDLKIAVYYLSRAAVRGDELQSNNISFYFLARVYDDQSSGLFNPELAYYFLLLADKLFPDYVTDLLKHYDRLSVEQMKTLRRRAAQWKAGMPLWEAPAWPSKPLP